MTDDDDVRYDRVTARACVLRVCVDTRAPPKPCVVGRDATRKRAKDNPRIREETNRIFDAMVSEEVESLCLISEYEKFRSKTYETRLSKEPIPIFIFF